MKVCQLCAVDFTLLKFLLPLIDGQTAAGYEVMAVCSDGENVKVLRERGYNVKTISIERGINPFKYIYSIWCLYKLFRREKFDLIHVHTPVAALIGRIAARIARVPRIVYTAHGFYFHDEMPIFQRRIHIAIEQFAGRFTNLLFTQSSEDAHAAVQLGIVPSNRVFAIGNGVNVKRFNPDIVNSRFDIRNELGIPNGAFVIGMVCRQVREKGIVEFLNAAQLLVRSYPDAWFLLVGDRLRSEHASTVDSHIKEASLNLGNRLVLPGMRNDLPQILGAIDLFTLPSWREGMPRTIIEAMMMKLPVVATNIRGSREEVINEETGLLVHLKDSVKLAEAFEKIMTNPLWGEKMGLAGHQRALKLYDESKVVAIQIKLIEKIFG